MKRSAKVFSSVLVMLLVLGLLPGMSLTASAKCYNTGKSTYTVDYSADDTAVNSIVVNFVYGDDTHKDGVYGDYIGKKYSYTFTLVFTTDPEKTYQSTDERQYAEWRDFNGGAFNTIVPGGSTVEVTLSAQNAAYGEMSGTYALSDSSVLGRLQPNTQYYALLCAYSNPYKWYTGEYFPVKFGPKTVTFDADGGSPAPDVQYVAKGAYATAPTGVTKAGYTLDGWYDGSNKFDFDNTAITDDITLTAQWSAIPATAPTVTGAADLELTYGYTEGSVSVTAAAAEGHAITGYQWYSNTTNSNTGGTVIIGATSESYAIPTGKNAGTTEYYYCVVTAIRSDNSQTATATSDAAAVTVDRAHAVPAAVTANDRTYDGTKKPLVTVKGTATGGEMRYALGTDDAAEPDASAYAATVPAVTNAGTYYVWYKAKGSGSYKDSAADKTAVTVSKADPVTPTVQLSAKIGQTLADVTLPDGWAWDDSSTAFAEPGDKAFPAHFAESTNYKSKNAELTVTVSFEVKNTKGSGGKHKLKKDDSLLFVFEIVGNSSGTFKAFEDGGKKVTVTGRNYSRQLTEKTDFTAKSGSLELTLTKKYLDSLKPGNYTVTAYFTVGAETATSSSSFKIVASSGSGVDTGDDTDTAAMLGVILSFLLSLSFIAYSLYSYKLTHANLLATFPGSSAAHTKQQADSFEDTIPEELSDDLDNIMAEEPIDGGFDDVIE